MRPRYPTEQKSGHISISEVSIDLTTRHELPPTLLALQHLYIDGKIREELLDHLSHCLIRGANTHGRRGLSLWEIWVLAVVRLCLDVDYESLCDLANNHRTLRGILGVLPQDGWGSKLYKCSTLKENIAQLDAQTLSKINTLVVESGHHLLAKKKWSRRRFA